MTTVAVIGASNDQRKFGNKAVRAFLRAGYKVIAVNPKLAAVGETVEGCDTYGTVLDVSHDIDLATLYVPPHIGEDVVSSYQRLAATYASTTRPMPANAEGKRAAQAETPEAVYVIAAIQ